MKRTNWLFAGAALGAGLMYFADPARGRERRALLDEQLRRMLNLPEADQQDSEQDSPRQEALAPRGFVSDPDAGGEQRSTSQRQSPLDQPWSPATRMMAGTLGVGLVMNFARRLSPGSLLFGLVGVGMVRKAMQDCGECMQEMSESIRYSAEPVTVEDCVAIKAPISQVYGFFAHPENYLRISEKVTNVDILPDGRFNKDMQIAGVPVHFAEQFLRQEQDQLLESATVEGSAVTYHKTMWFEDYDDGKTRVHLTFTYQPPAGKVGDKVGRMLGVDAKSILDELLQQAKAYIEAGKPIIDDQPVSEHFGVGSLSAAVDRTEYDDELEQREPAEERIVSPDAIDQAFSSDRERIRQDDRDLIGDAAAAQTNEDGQNFIENIQTAVTDIPTPDELHAADKETGLVEDDVSGGMQRKPR